MAFQDVKNVSRSDPDPEQLPVLQALLVGGAQGVDGGKVCESTPQTPLISVLECIKYNFICMMDWIKGFGGR